MFLDLTTLLGRLWHAIRHVPVCCQHSTQMFDSLMKYDDGAILLWRGCRLAVFDNVACYISLVLCTDFDTCLCLYLALLQLAMLYRSVSMVCVGCLGG